MLHPDHIACDHRGCKATTRKVDVAAVLRASGLEGDDLRRNAGAILSYAAEEAAEDGEWYFVGYEAHYCPEHGCTPIAKRRMAEQRTFSMSRRIQLRPTPCVEETQLERLDRLAALRKKRNDPFARRAKR